MDNFKVIYRILKHLEQSLDYEYTDIESISPSQLGISRERFEQLLIMLQDEGYIGGLVCTQTMSSDKRHLCDPVRPVIKLRGIEYLSENSMMKKVANTLKGIKDTIPWT